MDEETFLRKVKGACMGGATIIQLREKNKTTLEYYELALKVKNITDAYNIPLIIDDRIDVAVAVGCGVHLGNEDMPISIARKIMGEDCIMNGQGSGWFWYDCVYNVKSRYTSTGWRSYDMWNGYYTWISNVNYIFGRRGNHVWK